MPVTTRVAPVDVKTAPALSTYDPKSLLLHVCLMDTNPEDSVLDSSFPESTTLRPAGEFGEFGTDTNGFVGAVLYSYTGHTHLVLRPEDVWFAILTQFSFYVNKHAEELRERFVDHAGKKKLKITQSELDMPAFMLKMTHMLQENIKCPEFREWIMPNFTTTTETDRVAASVIMMGTLQKYFRYGVDIACGIPSVTLLGEKKDWENILSRLEFLTTFGEDHPEVAMWHSGLEASVGYMVQTFVSPDSPDVVRFWQRSVHSYSEGCAGDRMITGWISSFCFWDPQGNVLPYENRASSNWKREVAKHGRDWWFDGHRFGSLSWGNVPSAFVHVPIDVKIGTEKFVAKAFAGSVGFVVRDSATLFEETRHPRRKGSGDSDETLIDDSSTQKSAWFKQIVRKLLCFKSVSQYTGKYNVKMAPTEEKGASQSPGSRDDMRVERKDENVPQLSDLSELGRPWEYENGGRQDALQPVIGWWVVRTSEGQYGKDPDVPDLQFDSDADDYDRDLAYNGRPLRDHGQL